MKLSPVQWLLGEKEGETESDSGVSVHYLVQFFFRMRRLTFFRGQGVFLLRLRLLQLGLVEAGHLRNIGLVGHGRRSGNCNASQVKFPSLKKNNLRTSGT